MDHHESPAHHVNVTVPGKSIKKRRSWTETSVTLRGINMCNLPPVADHGSEGGVRSTEESRWNCTSTPVDSWPRKKLRRSSKIKSVAKSVAMIYRLFPAKHSSWFTRKRCQNGSEECRSNLHSPSLLLWSCWLGRTLLTGEQVFRQATVKTFLSLSQ